MKRRFFRFAILGVICAAAVLLVANTIAFADAEPTQQAVEQQQDEATGDQAGDAEAADEQQEAGFPWVNFFVGVVNFAIFVGIIVYFGGPYIQQYFADRRAEFVREMEAAQEARKEAEAKLEEYNAKLEALEQERQALLDEYHAQGEREKQRIIEEAKEQVERMRADAEATIDQEVKRAKAMLENQAVELAVEMAREKVAEQLDDDVQQALFERYLSELDDDAKAA